MHNSLLNYYKDILGINEIPEFLIKYLSCPTLIRLKEVGYFCGMDYASKDIYQFSEYISRYDHSLTVALLTYRLTKNKKDTLAALFHDIATPCFSHVIDYMNNDYSTQESTEEYTNIIMYSDKYLEEYLKQDNISIEEIIDFKKYSIVDNKRPKVCADRLDGVILNSIGWTKNITQEDIYNIINDLYIGTNEDQEQEICFKTPSIATKVIELSKVIDIYCHSNEDNYMMQLLANITKKAIQNELITYESLYELTEEEIFRKLEKTDNIEIKELYEIFKSISKKDIPRIELPNIKIRNLNPYINNHRLKEIGE